MPLINGLKTEELLDIVETVKQDWKTGKTVWTASAQWLYGFRVESESRASRYRRKSQTCLPGRTPIAVNSCISSKV